MAKKKRLPMFCKSCIEATNYHKKDKTNFISSITSKEVKATYRNYCHYCHLFGSYVCKVLRYNGT